jgi:hypothetical protein
MVHCKYLCPLTPALSPSEGEREERPAASRNLSGAPLFASPVNCD